MVLVTLFLCLVGAQADEEWLNATAQLEAIIRADKALQPNGTLDEALLQSEPRLLSVYVDLGVATLELAKQERQEFQFEKSATAQSNILRVVPYDTERWWFARVRLLETLVERGGLLSLDRLPSEKPAVDGGRFGLKPKFEALLEKLRAAKAVR